MYSKTLLGQLKWFKCLDQFEITTESGVVPVRGLIIQVSLTRSSQRKLCADWIGREDMEPEVDEEKRTLRGGRGEITGHEGT